MRKKLATLVYSIIGAIMLYIFINPIMLALFKAIDGNIKNAATWIDVAYYIQIGAAVVAGLSLGGLVFVVGKWAYDFFKPKDTGAAKVKEAVKESSKVVEIVGKEGKETNPATLEKLSQSIGAIGEYVEAFLAGYTEKMTIVQIITEIIAIIKVEPLNLMELVERREELKYYEPHLAMLLTGIHHWSPAYKEKVMMQFIEHRQANQSFAGSCVAEADKLRELIGSLANKLSELKLKSSKRDARQVVETALVNLTSLDEALFGYQLMTHEEAFGQRFRKGLQQSTNFLAQFAALTGSESPQSVTYGGSMREAPRLRLPIVQEHSPEIRVRRDMLKQPARPLGSLSDPIEPRPEPRDYET
jgi:hypothetical protein